MSYNGKQQSQNKQQIMHFMRKVPTFQRKPLCRRGKRKCHYNTALGYGWTIKRKYIYIYGSVAAQVVQSHAHVPATRFRYGRGAVTALEEGFLLDGESTMQMLHDHGSPTRPWWQLTYHKPREFNHNRTSFWSISDKCVMTGTKPQHKNAFHGTAWWWKKSMKNVKLFYRRLYCITCNFKGISVTRHVKIPSEKAPQLVRPAWKGAGTRQQRRRSRKKANKNQARKIGQAISRGTNNGGRRKHYRNGSSEARRSTTTGKKGGNVVIIKQKTLRVKPGIDVMT